ncbi:unnamed protein product [Porites evermanni]|uniref:Uncharacterized protein n=1 Tax=Porites evermanni TaxID=104178 RepID=A0ABN8R4F0_9CNID|nr:unnamed protein product [Porites evermanni]
MMKLQLFFLVVLVHLLANPSEAQIPQCLPALATYLQNQTSLLQSVKNDLDATKKQLQQAIGQWPPGHYCILASGSCPPGFSRSQGHMRALKMYSHTPTYITPATFGSSRIQCHGPCGRYGQWVGELYIAACCK